MSKANQSKEVLNAVRVVLLTIAGRDDINEKAAEALAGLDGAIDFLLEVGVHDNSILAVVEGLTVAFGGNGEDACNSLLAAAKVVNALEEA